MKTLKELAEDAIETVKSGYYNSLSSPNLTAETRPTSSRYKKSKPPSNGTGSDRRSVVQAIDGAVAGGRGRRRVIICEIKFASPSRGKISGRHDQVSQIARDMEAGGAAGLSVLTEPENFHGSLVNLVTARETTNLPIIMKDIVVSEEQINAASNLGASAILFIQEVFSEGYARHNLTLQNAIKLAREKRLEVIVETHSKDGLVGAAKLDCDIVGINNRDLKTFKTTVNTTLDLLEGDVVAEELKDRVIMSESGFECPSDISDLIKRLRARGSPVPKAFLIGTSIMKSTDIQSKVRGFVEEAVKT